MRLDKEVYDYIENQVIVDNFTDKFHNLVYMLIKDMPNMRNELDDLNNSIKRKAEELHKIDVALQRLRSIMWNYQNIINSMDSLKSSIDELVDFCNNVKSS